MKLVEAIEKCPTVSLVSEEGDGDMYKAVLRVHDTKAWQRVVLAVLRSPGLNDDQYGTSVRKEYWIEDGKPTFGWVLIVWGELDLALKPISAIFTRPVERPEEPEAIVAPEQPRGHQRLRRTERMSADGSTKIVETTIPLPHVRAHDRNLPRKKPGNLRYRGGGFAMRGIGDFDPENLGKGMEEAFTAQQDL
jgi:hypothetical protein